MRKVCGCISVLLPATTCDIKVSFLLGRQQQGFLKSVRERLTNFTRGSPSVWNACRPAVAWQRLLVSQGWQMEVPLLEFHWLSPVCCFPSLSHSIFTVVFYLYMYTGCLTTVTAPFLGLFVCYRNGADCELLSSIKIALYVVVRRALKFVDSSQAVSCAFWTGLLTFERSALEFQL